MNAVEPLELVQDADTRCDVPMSVLTKITVLAKKPSMSAATGKRNQALFAFVTQSGTWVLAAAMIAAAGLSTATAANAANLMSTISGLYSTSATANEAQSEAALSPGLAFIPITPCRAVDTRNPVGPFGGPQLAAATTREFDLPQSACSIPSSALAYSLNVTVVPDGPLDYLTIWPSGQTQPVVSTLNSDGRVKANAAITPAGSNGGVSVFVPSATHVILDINGYFVPVGTASSLMFYPIIPCRVADTRNPNGPLGGPSITGGTSRSIPLQSGSCGLPAAAQAYSINMTAVPRGPLNYLTLWPTGETQPLVSTLNSLAGTVTANAAIVPAGTDGDVSVYVTNTSDVVMDVDGYFAPPAAEGLALYATTPCRVLDTRTSSGPFSGRLTVDVANSVCAPSATAEAYVLNATVVPTGSLNYLTLWASGATQPVVSTLNADSGVITSNMAVVPTADGSIDAFATDSTQLILDISGYFAPAPPNFTLTALPAEIQAPAGGTGTFGLLAKDVNGFTGTIEAALTGSAGLTPNPATVTLVPGIAQTITVSAASDAPSGAISIAATSGMLTQTLSEGVATGPNFGIYAPTGSLEMGGYVNGAFVVSPISGFAGTVSAQITGFPPGLLVGVSPLPSGFSYGNGSGPVYLGATCELRGPTCQSTYFSIVYAGAAAGTYPLTLTATSGSITHTETLSLVVTPPNFSMSVNPASVTIAPGGQQQTVNLSVSAYGASSNVNITVEDLPAGITASPSGDMEGSTSILLAASPSAAPGTYIVIIAGNDAITTGPNTSPPGPPLTAATQFKLTIAAPSPAQQTSVEH